MTNQEINEAVARNLGWIVNEYSWGFKWARDKSVQCADMMSDSPPDYCTSISAAWEIVEKISLGGRIGIHVMNKITSISLRTETGYYTSEAETTPMAICLAFLKLP